MYVDRKRLYSNKKGQEVVVVRSGCATVNKDIYAQYTHNGKNRNVNVVVEVRVVLGLGLLGLGLGLGLG